jgi:hypothetical protein
MTGLQKGKPQNVICAAAQAKWARQGFLAPFDQMAKRVDALEKQPSLGIAGNKADRCHLQRSSHLALDHSITHIFFSSTFEISM